MRLLSGIKPSGDLHIGNYFGSIKQWVDLLNSSSDTQAIFFIADLHAITVYQDPKKLKEKTYEIAAVYFAAGLDYKKHIVFVQSDNPDHPYLNWLLTTVTPYGWLTRMTQFKDKRQKLKNYGEVIGAGLFNYPVLMAADILLYDADSVPVGEDQVQHVELTRDIAKRFNKLYGETFKIPEYTVNRTVARIKDLQYPTKKMSKSDDNPLGCVYLLDSIDDIRLKFKRAVTDSEKSIRYDVKNKPGISNLLAILSASTGKKIEDLEKEYAGKTYAQFKEDVAEAVIAVIKPLQQRVKEYLSDRSELERLFKLGVEKAREISTPKLNEALSKMGFYKYAKK